VRKTHDSRHDRNAENPFFAPAANGRKIKTKVQPYNPFQFRVVIKVIEAKRERYACINGANQSCSDVGEIKIV